MTVIFRGHEGRHLVVYGVAKVPGRFMVVNRVSGGERRCGDDVVGSLRPPAEPHRLINVWNARNSGRSKCGTWRAACSRIRTFGGLRKPNKPESGVRPAPLDAENEIARAGGV